MSGNLEKCGEFTRRGVRPTVHVSWPLPRRHLHLLSCATLWHPQRCPEYGRPTHGPRRPILHPLQLPPLIPSAKTRPCLPRQNREVATAPSPSGPYSLLSSKELPLRYAVVSECLQLQTAPLRLGSVCGTPCAMDAGWPLKAPEAAPHGLIKEGMRRHPHHNPGLEDFLGDMDFKVPAPEGITPASMDIECSVAVKDHRRRPYTRPARPGCTIPLEKDAGSNEKPRADLSRMPAVAQLPHHPEADRTVIWAPVAPRSRHTEHQHQESTSRMRLSHDRQPTDAAAARSPSGISRGRPAGSVKASSQRTFTR